GAPVGLGLLLTACGAGGFPGSQKPAAPPQEIVWSRQPLGELRESYQLAFNRRSVLLFCAWCRRYGRRDGAVRPLSGCGWMRVSRAFVVAAAKADFTSGGICPACTPRFAADLGVARAARRYAERAA